MAQPIIIQDVALRNYLKAFQPVFGIPQWKYFVTVLMGLIHCQASPNAFRIIARSGSPGDRERAQSFPDQSNLDE